MSLLKNNKVLIAVIALVLIFAGTVLVFSIQMNALSQKTFTGGGYILQTSSPTSSTENSSSDKGNAATSSSAEGSSIAPSEVHFDAGANYRLRYPQSVAFVDNQGKSVTVDQKNYIHYDDGSLASFDKGVFIDLDEIQMPPVYYYDLPANQEMHFGGTSYSIENSAVNISLTNFLLKIDEARYLVASDDIQFIANGQTVRRFQGSGSYLEVSYIDSGIIMFSNNQGAYQTIASDAQVTLGNEVVIDFGSKLISDKGDTKLSLSQMVVGADDNVETAPDNAQTQLSNDNTQNNEGTASPETNTPTGNADNSGISGGAPTTEGGEGSSAQASGGTAGDSSSSSSSSSSGGSATDNSGEASEENSLHYPSFNITGGTTSPVGFNATVNIVDENNMLTSGTHIKIVDAVTGEVVYESDVAAGILDFDVSTANLKPNTEYVMSATATYSDGKNDYTKSFLDKVFTTDGVGISFVKDYVTQDTLAMKVTVGSYSNVASAQLRILDASGVSFMSKDVDMNKVRTSEGDQIIFDSLSADTLYQIELHNIVYSDITVESFGDAVSYRTLKQTPKFSVPIVTTDRRTSSFNFSAGIVEDPNAGITGYVWEVYRSDQVAVNANGEITIKGDPVKTITPAAGSDATLAVDNVTIMPATAYVVRAVASFDDNEKTVRYTTPFCAQPFSIEGVSYPSLRFELSTDEEDYLTFEQVKGVVYIDNAYAITASYANPLVITYTNSLGTLRQDTIAKIDSLSNGTLALPFVHNGLRANDRYTISVYALVDLQDGNPPARQYIGSAQFSTTKPPTARVQYSPEDSDDSFAIKLSLTEEENNNSIALAMKTLSFITVSLYEGSLTSGTPLATQTFSGGVDAENDPYGSTFYRSLYAGVTNPGDPIVITPKTFSLNNNDLKPKTEYTIVVGPASDYTEWPNVIPLTSTSYVVRTISTWPDLPEDRETGVSAQPILNVNAPFFGGSVDPNLDDTTIVGYKIQCNFPNGNKIARQLIYYVRDARTNDILKEYHSDISPNGEIPGKVLFLNEEDLKRGRQYLFTYEMIIDLVGKGNEIDFKTYPQCAEAGAVLSSTVQDCPLQAASLKLYPLSSKATAMDWKYKISDVDSVLADRAENESDAAFLTQSSSAGAWSRMALGTAPDENGWYTLSLPVRTRQTYTLDLKQNLYLAYAKTSYKITSDVAETQLLKNYFEGPVALSMNSFTLKPQINPDDRAVNRLRVVMAGDSTVSSAVLDNVIAMQITCASATKTVTVIKPVTTDIPSAEITALVPFSDIKNLMAQDFHVSATLLYDTGQYGFKYATNSTLFTVQRTAAKAEDCAYLNMPGQNGAAWTLQPTASGSSYQFSSYFEFNPDATTVLNYKNMISSAEGHLGISLGSQGVMVNDAGGVETGMSVTPKEIAVAGSDISSSSTFKFDQIIPLVKVSTVAPELDRANIALQLQSTDSVDIKDNRFLIKLWTYNKTTNAQEEVGTYYYDRAADGVDKNIVLPSDVVDDPSKALVSGATYYFTVSAYTRGAGTSGSYALAQLVDANEGNPKVYSFTTLGEVAIDIESVKYKATNYHDKAIVLTYNLSRTLGFSLHYELFKADAAGAITDPTPLSVDWPASQYSNHNVVSLSYNPGELSGTVPLDAYYVVKITAYPLNSSSSNSVGSAQSSFHLLPLNEPLMSVTAMPEVEKKSDGSEDLYYKLNYRVSVLDVDGVVVDDQYRVRFFKLTDPKTQIASKYDGEIFSTKNYNTVFTFGSEEASLQESSAYVLEIYGVKDKTNGGGKSGISSFSGEALNNPELLLVAAKASTLSRNGVDLGDVQVAPTDGAKNKFQLEFYDSVNLTSIDTLSYTVYSSSATVVSGKVEPFKLTAKQFANGITYYVFTPNVSLETADRYYIQVKYLRSGKNPGDPTMVVAEGTYTYSYSGAPS